jgi:hypothetical protein
MPANLHYLGAINAAGVQGAFIQPSNLLKFAVWHRYCFCQIRSLLERYFCVFVMDKGVLFA